MSLCHKMNKYNLKYIKIENGYFALGYFQILMFYCILQMNSAFKKKYIYTFEQLCKYRYSPVSSALYG